MILAAAGFSLLLGFLSLLRLQPFDHHVAAVLCLLTVLHGALFGLFVRLERAPAAPEADFRRSALWVFLLAAAMRLPLLATAPTLSDDVYRYVWDGRVQLAGINPYEYAPADSTLSRFWGDEHPHINHARWHTVYPPLSEAAFHLGAMLTPAPIGQKVLFAAFDLASVALLLVLLRRRGRSAAWAALYAWNPVTVVEFAGSGHNDSLMIFFLLLAFLAHERRRDGRAALGLAAATMSKWIPAIGLPWLAARRNGKALGAFVLACAALSVPFVIGRLHVVPYPHGLPPGADWMFNCGIYRLVAALVGPPLVRKIAVGLPYAAFLLFWARRRRDDLIGYFFGATLALLLLAPAVHPWYLSWLLPYAALLGSSVAVVWAWAASLSYAVLVPYVARGDWSLPHWVPVVEYGAVAAALLFGAGRQARRGISRRPAPAPMPSARVAVVIPALNEEAAIGDVVRGVRDRVAEVIVVDNGSTDRTAEVAQAAGARVEREPRRGYGAAVKRGVDAAGPACDVLVVMDGDRADVPEDLDALLDPIRRGEAHFVLGNRTASAEAGSLMPQQRFGNWLTCALLRGLYGHRYSDMGPFRAIRRDALASLDLRDRGYGWNVEMQLKALKAGLNVVEVPVRYRRRVGRSKISGTVKGTVMAGIVILSSVARYACDDMRR